MTPIARVENAIARYRASLDQYTQLGRQAMPQLERIAEQGLDGSPEDVRRAQWACRWIRDHLEASRQLDDAEVLLAQLKEDEAAARPSPEHDDG